MTKISAHNDLQVVTSNRQILKIALPICLALLVPQLNFITNNIFISRLGETELATAGITGVFYLVFALVGNGLNSGIQALIARRAGENRPGEIGRLFSQSIWVSMIFAFLAITIIYSTAHLFLSSVLTMPVVQQEAVEFMKIRIWGVPFLYLFQAGNAFLVGTNNSRYMKYGFMVQAGLNILLDYLLIYGHWGLPKLGFNGAAVGSVISEAIGMLVVFGIIFYKKYYQRFRLFVHLRFNHKLSGLIFKQTSPLIAQFLLSVGSWLLFYILIENKGERPLAISNTMRNVYGIFGIFSWAFASTSNAMVSNIIGQNKKEEVIPLINKIMKLSVLFTFTLCLLINILPAAFLYLYGRDEHFISEAIPVIRVVSIGIVCMSMATVWLNAVTGTGNTKINLAIELAAIVVYCTYVWLALKIWNLSLIWAWVAEMIYWIILLSLSWLYIRSGRWKGKVI